MIKKITSFLFEDIKWKLLSVLLALVLWLVGMNVNNPSVTEYFSRSLKVSNMESLTRDGIVILNVEDLRAELITVGIRAPRNKLPQLNALDSIETSIDMRLIFPDMVLEMIETSGQPVRVSMDVLVDILEGYERINTRPRVVYAELDKFVRQTRDIQVIIEGEVPEGHELVSVDCVNQFVYVSGAKSLVDDVHAVVCRVDVSGASTDFDKTVALVAIDRDGRDITNRSEIELSVRETPVHATILPYKSIPLSLGWTGTLAHNHIVTEILITPEQVNIAGPPEMLNALNNVHLDTLDLTNANTTQTLSLDIRRALPDARFFLCDGQETDAVIIVVIEPMRSREFLFPVGEIQLLGFPAGAVQLLNNESVRFSVIGSETDMAALTREHIRVSLNLMGLTTGEQSVPLTIQLPQGINLIGEPPSLELLLTTPDPNEPVAMPEEMDTPEPGEPVAFDPMLDFTATIGSDGYTEEEFFAFDER